LSGNKNLVVIISVFGLELKTNCSMHLRVILMVSCPTAKKAVRTRRINFQHNARTFKFRSN
jgi:hypothetical protein